MSTLRSENTGAELSSGNVFADLGFDNPEEGLLKAKLAWEIVVRHKPRRTSRPLTKAA